MSAPRARVVVSAVNVTEGGPLTVLRDCVTAAQELFGNAVEIVVLAHDAKLLPDTRATVLSFPAVKHSWLRRLHFEWFASASLARALTPDLWLALHDITPRVGATPQVVYCHNPAPFHVITLRDAWLHQRFALFVIFYQYAYRINIRRNALVVVQQEWLRERFSRWVDLDKVFVAHPRTSRKADISVDQSRERTPLILLYPALPRVHKNFETVCDAVCMLPETVRRQMQLRLTISGTENRYARWLRRRYSNVPQILFAGAVVGVDMPHVYSSSHAVVFPSRLETWGLPLTEAACRDLPVFAADLPYAHETLASYSRVRYVPANDARSWCDALMQFVQDGTLCSALPVAGHTDRDAPDARNWVETWAHLHHRFFSHIPL